MRYLLLLTALLTANSHAYTGTGNDWIERARNYLRAKTEGMGATNVDGTEVARWLHVVQGLSTAYGEMAYRYAICYPDGSTLGQLSEVAAQYLVDNPAARAKQLSFLVWSAHHDAFRSMQNPNCPDHDAFMEVHAAPIPQ